MNFYERLLTIEHERHQQAIESMLHTFHLDAWLRFQRARQGSE